MNKFLQIVGYLTSVAVAACGLLWLYNKRCEYLMEQEMEEECDCDACECDECDLTEECAEEASVAEEA